ncbi:MAG: bifunctional oligoribonuclease/PAP phosphatase NrnA [Bacteroidetes bacterium]|nr:bifunctional oligoribonuclease/PAP phosphatase NrnA [Bacteroidota bacterium]
MNHLEDNLDGISDCFTGRAKFEIVITTHHKPDADALGSTLGLYHFLKSLGHRVSPVSPTDYATFLQWMPGNEDVINFEESEEVCSELVETADLIFCLDFNDLSRINKLGEYVKASNAVKVMIDHHREPSGFDDYRYWTINTSSTAELIYDAILKYGSLDSIDQKIATCLYSGIMTDTGSFRFDSTSSNTHRAIANLIDKGADSAEIHRRLFDNFTLNRFRFMGYVLYQKLEIIPEYNTALVYITREELKMFEAQTGDTEGFVNFGLSVKDVVFSALIVDRTVLVKMSFRSSGDFPCNEFASEYFSGGGHKNAAGGSSKDSLDLTVQKFRKLLPQYSKYLKS